MRWRWFRRRAPLLLPRQAYGRWAALYPPFPHNRLMEIEQAAMLRLMPPLVGQTVLDLACGTGRYARIALEAGAQRVIGVDDSPEMLRRMVGTRAQAGMTALPFPAAAFDVVLCGLAIGHLLPEEFPHALGEIGRLLRPGGIALISDFHPYLALSGGQRSFTDADGVRFVVRHSIYFVSDYWAAFADTPMILTGIAEPLAEIGGANIPAALVLRVQRVS